MPSRELSLRVAGTSVLTVLTVLTGLAASGVHTANTHSIPIPLLDRILALALPLVQLVATILLACGCRIADIFSPPSSKAVRKRQKQLKTVGFFVLWLLSALDAVLLSTSAVALDAESLDCTLDRTWRDWFMHKNAGAIRSIQDRYECCGLHSMVDKAWPFPDKTHGVKACQEAYGRQQSCMGEWTTNARGTLATFTAIGAASLALKLLAAIIFSIIQLSEHRYDSDTNSRPSDPARRRLLVGQVNRASSPDLEINAEEQSSAVWSNSN